MATNRTATAHWKNLRRHIIREVRDRGQTRCELCNMVLHWGTYQQPLSPEVDHIIPVTRGGTDDRENLRVICRKCNGTKGNRDGMHVPHRHVVSFEPYPDGGGLTTYSDGTTCSNLIDW